MYTPVHSMCRQVMAAKAAEEAAVQKAREDAIREEMAEKARRLKEQQDREEVSAQCVVRSV